MAKKGDNLAKFVWDEVKLKAATELANGNQKDDDILPKLGVSKRTLSRWKEHPDFQLKISEIIADIDISMKSERIKIAKKIIKAQTEDLDPKNWTKKDILEWLKYVAEEKDETPTEHKSIRIIWDDGKGDNEPRTDN